MDLFIYLIFLPFLILIIALNKVKAQFFRVFNYILTFICSLTLFLSGIFVLSASLFISVLLIPRGTSDFIVVARKIQGKFNKNRTPEY